uniref:Uncharacterized protein n=1 Tax=Medicago truncatula TaxID=3880 RepID=I3SGM2_MEDTR|nr:unknown [Medicago truncatula]
MFTAQVHLWKKLSFVSIFSNLNSLKISVTPLNYSRVHLEE